MSQWKPKRVFNKAAKMSGGDLLSVSLLREERKEGRAAKKHATETSRRKKREEAEAKGALDALLAEEAGEASDDGGEP